MATTMHFVAPAAAAATSTTTAAGAPAPAAVPIDPLDAVDDRYSKRSNTNMLAPLRSLAVRPRPSMRIRHVERSSDKPTATASSSLFSAARLHVAWKRSAWLIVALGMLVCLACVGASSNNRNSRNSATTTPTTATARRPSDWYVVLVSIPVLDKVLPLKHLAEELLHRGYRVGFALPENCRQWVSDLETLEFLSLGNIMGAKGHHRNFIASNDALAMSNVYANYAASLRFYASFHRPMFAALVETLEDDRPHLLVVDRFTFAGIDASDALSLPRVVFASQLLMEMDEPPAFVPAPFTNYSMHTPSVLERCLNSFYRLRFRLTHVAILETIRAARFDHGLHAIDATSSTSLVLVTSVIGLDVPRAIAPQFQLIGALQSRRIVTSDQSNYKQSVMLRDLSVWLQLDPQPVVLVSFPPDVVVAPHVVATLMDGLEALDARIVWRIHLQQSTTFDLRSRKRSSVFFLSAAADADDALLLSVAPTAVFVTPGTLHALHDALVRHVPVLALPHSAEQLESASAVARAGAAIVLDVGTFNAARVHDAMVSLLDTSDANSYRKCAEHTGELVVAAGGASRAVDYVAAVMEVGSTFFVPVKATQALYMTLLLDVYVVYGAILCGAAVILRTVVAVLCSIFQLPPELDDEDEEEEEQRANRDSAAGATKTTTDGNSSTNGSSGGSNPTSSNSTKNKTV